VFWLGRRRLDNGEVLREQGAAQPGVSLVLAGPRPPLCFAVDEVGDVLSIATATLLAPPATLDPKTRACVRGVHLSHQRLITVLETSVLLEGLLQEPAR